MSHTIAAISTPAGAAGLGVVRLSGDDAVSVATKLFRPMVEKMENRAMNKKDSIEKSYFWGLLLFVGIPLPGTGAWTGALIASLLDIPKKKSIPAIALGVCMAAALMGGLSLVFEGLFF